MSADPGIICYQHCQKDTKVFSLDFPSICNFCYKDISNEELRIPPFRVPFPFKEASKEPNSIVIKPTVGDFLNVYENSSDLHIGVTDSFGRVFEYDCNGKLKSDGEEWRQCIVIKTHTSKNLSFKCHWDTILNEVYEHDCWSSERYDCEEFNCYAFVLAFLKKLQLTNLSSFITDKYNFCQHFVSPQTRIAAKYISLYRQLKTNSMVVL